MRALGFLILFSTLLTNFAWSKEKSESTRTLWPFDQRQIVLLKKEGVEFPDLKTVAQVMDVFVRLGRVRWMTLKGKPGELLPFEVPADFQWQSSATVRNMGLRFEADGMMVLSKKGVQLELQWFSTTDGTPLFFETLSLPQATTPEQETARRDRIQKWLQDIWSKIPGEGYVVKRDMETISIEGAEQIGFKVGDILETKRLGKVERHPLLKTLMKIDSSPTGRAEITSIGKPYSIAKILYESQVDPIQEGDRYLRTEIPSDKAKTVDAAGKATSTNQKNGIQKKDLGGGRSFLPIFVDSENSTDTEQEKSTTVEGADGPTVRVDSGTPEYNVLDLTFKATYKKMRYQENTQSTTTPLAEMAAWAPGFQVAAKLFFTKEILILADFQYSFFSFKGLDTTYNVGTIASGAYQVGFGGYYRFPFYKEPGFRYQGEILGGLGFRNLNYSMAAITNDIAPSAKKYTGYELAVMIQVPVHPDVALDFGASKIFFAKLTETAYTGGDETSNSLWFVHANVKYKWTANSEVLAGIQMENASTTFTGDGTRTVASSSTTWSGTSFELGYAQRF